MKKTTIAIGIAATGLLLSACGKKPGAYENLADGSAAATAETDATAAADALWEQRADVTKLKEAIAAYEAVATADPSNRKALLRASRGWYFLAAGFTDSKSEQIPQYLKAIEWGKRCMALNSTFAERVNGGEKESEAASALTKEDVPCTYWTASALGRWAKANGIAKSLRHIGTVKAYISKVEELEPEYYYTGPARYWGAYYSVLPSFAGRDLELSAQKFEQSIAGSPEYLGSYILRAENLAVANQDVAQFDADLKTVLTFDLDSAPALRPENEREQVRAKELQAKRADFFDKKALEAAE